LSGSGGSIPGRPGVRGPGRVPVGIGPRRCSKGRAGSAPDPPGRGLPWPGCCGRIGCPGRGPLGRSREMSGSGPRFPVGKGPRFPEGRSGVFGRGGPPGRAGTPGRAGAPPGAAAAGRVVEGWVLAGAAAAGRAGADPGCEGGTAGRMGVGAGGAAGFAAAGAPAGAGGFGTILGAAGAPDGGGAG